MARALWDGGKDRARARELLQAAEATYLEQKNQERIRRLAEWKAKRRL